MPGGANPGKAPRSRKIDWRTLVRKAHPDLKKPVVVYPFSRGHNRKDSGPFKGIYDVAYLLGTLFADITANNATLTLITYDAEHNAMKNVDGGDYGQAQVIVDTILGRPYELLYRYHSNGVASAASVSVYNGDQLGFGSSEPSVVATSGVLDAASSWTEGVLNFTAQSEITTIGLETLITEAWFDIKRMRLTAL